MSGEREISGIQEQRGKWNGRALRYSFDEDEEDDEDIIAKSLERISPLPRKPSLGKMTSKHNDLVELTSDSESETQVNRNGESFHEKRTNFSNMKANTVATSNDVENRREAFTKNRSGSSIESSPRRLSQRSSFDQSEYSSFGDRRRSSSRKDSSSEGYEQRSALKLKASWEARNTSSEPLKTPVRPKPLVGHTGASALKSRFENSSSFSNQTTPASRKMSRSGSIDSQDAMPVRVSASALKARFEQKANEQSQAVKRNFVINKSKVGSAAKKFNGPAASNKCMVCTKSVYPMEKLEVEGRMYHKFCFKCETCKRTVGLGSYAALEGRIYCKPHLKQLFRLKGNYDEGFGRAQRKADWIKADGPALASTTAASNDQGQVTLNGVADKEETSRCELNGEEASNNDMNGIEAEESGALLNTVEEVDEKYKTADEISTVVENGNPNRNAVFTSDEEE